jgi:hypothetical protein
MKKLTTIVACFVFAMAMTIPVAADAEDYYVGYTFIHESSSHYCAIIRFRAFDGSFTLTEADGLYSLIANQLVSGSSYTFSHTLPSQCHASNITGEALANAFLQYGTGVCTVGGQPVDGVVFVSLFNCEYQLADQMCVRLYVDTGALNLSSFGIPQGPAAIGGIFIKKEVWTAASSFIVGNPGLIPSLPLSTYTVGDKINSVLQLMNYEMSGQ